MPGSETTTSDDSVLLASEVMGFPAPWSATFDTHDHLGEQGEEEGENMHDNSISHAMLSGKSTWPKLVTNGARAAGLVFEKRPRATEPDDDKFTTPQKSMRGGSTTSKWTLARALSLSPAPEPTAEELMQVPDDWHHTPADWVAYKTGAAYAVLALEIMKQRQSALAPVA